MDRLAWLSLVARAAHSSGSLGITRVALEHFKNLTIRYWCEQFATRLRNKHGKDHKSLATRSGVAKG
jgi:hypothetical protein